MGRKITLVNINFSFNLGFILIQGNELREIHSKSYLIHAAYESTSRVYFQPQKKGIVMIS